jgi:hypothetical protein
MILKLCAGAAIAAAILVILWLLRGVMLTPVKHGKNQHMTVVITVRGAAPELEQTVDGLLWLIQNGTLRADLVIRDAGMDAETRRTAEALTGGGRGIELREST